MVDEIVGCGRSVAEDAQHVSLVLQDDVAKRLDLVGQLLEADIALGDIASVDRLDILQELLVEKADLVQVFLVSRRLGGDRTAFRF